MRLNRLIFSVLELRNTHNESGQAQGHYLITNPKLFLYLGGPRGISTHTYCHLLT